MASELSQDELALESRVDRTYIFELENDHKSPTVEILFRLCPVLGIAASELIAEVGMGLTISK